MVRACAPYPGVFCNKQTHKVRTNMLDPVQQHNNQQHRSVNWCTTSTLRTHACPPVARGWRQAVISAQPLYTLASETTRKMVPPTVRSQVSPDFDRDETCIWVMKVAVSTWVWRADMSQISMRVREGRARSWSDSQDSMLLFHRGSSSAARVASHGDDA